MTRPRRVPPPLAAALLAAGLAAGCAPTAPPGRAEPRFVVGEPYSLGGVWSYPREDYGLSQSGLMSVLPDARRGRRTANGEVHDPVWLVAAHRTLQLPAVVRVWNLDTGRELRVRVNDRGPVEPGRVLGVSRRTAELLEVRPGEPARVRIAVDGEASRAAIAGLPGAEGPHLAIAAAPVGAVDREQLPPPLGARAAVGGTPAKPQPGGSVTLTGISPDRSPTRPPARLPEEVADRGAAPSSLVVDVGTFFRRDLAERRAGAVGGAVEPVGAGRQAQYRVRLGPFATPKDADRALEGALRRGIPDAMIVLD